MSLMGVDVGTTGVKAVVFDESGRLLSRAYEEYPLLFPFPGACELDSRTVVEASLRVIGEAANHVRNADPVRAIGIASQGEAFTPIDDYGRMLGNMMTSSDARAQSLVQPWAETFGEKRLYKTTGHTAYPMYSLFKLLWLKQNQPKVWARTWKFLFCADLLAYVLTGETQTDYTMAARTMMFDVARKQWSAAILEGLELSADQLPEVAPSGGIVGTVKPAIGLGQDVRVAVCGHDQPVGALGCGAAAPGRAAYSIGTVECICPAADRLILSTELMAANLATYPHVLPDTYTTVAFNVTGGSVLKWVRDNYATEEASEALVKGEDPYDHIIAAASDEPAGVILLPHFGPTGTPHFDAQGAGVLFGLKLSTSRAEVLRAVLEGITYEMKWNAAILEESGFGLTELRAIGGGAKSETWMQIKADILGIPLTTMRVTEATCMGAALLAGHGAGITDVNAPWAEPIRTFEPQRKYTSLYEERFALYKELYQSLGRARQMLNQRSTK
jgi:xylulokinase